MRNLNGIIIHCTATPPGFMEGKSSTAKVAEVKRWHVEDRGWSDIGYHYLIDRDGTVKQGRPLSRTGAHVRGHNTGTVGISLFGARDSTAHDDFQNHFTPAQDMALRALIAELRSKYPSITSITGHNEYAAKACPGFQVAKWLESPWSVPAPQPRITPTPQPAPHPKRVPDEVMEALEESDSDKSKTDLFNQIAQWVTGGGGVALLANFKEVTDSIDPVVLSAMILAGVAIFAIASYTRSSRKRKGTKAQAALMSLVREGMN